MTKIKGPASWLWCLWALCVAPLAQATGQAPQSASGHGILYEVRAPDAQAPSYLLGTIHSEDPRVVDLPAPVKEAFDASPNFALEVIPDQQAILKAMMAMTYTDGRSLREVLPKDLYKETADALGGLGMTPDAFRDFKPWAVVTLLSVPRAKTGDFLDIRLYRSATAASKTVKGLESMEEQLAVFDSMAPDDQIALLRETLTNLDRLPAMFESLVQAYLSRDLGQLSAESERFLEGGDPRLVALFRQSVIASRNRRMAERMTPLLDQGGWFIAVGALHLPSETGLLDLLAERGYKVTPVY